MSEEELNARFNIVEKLTNLFKFERMLHLIVTSLSLIILFISFSLIIIKKGNADSTELTLMFGSSGLITYAAGRLLRMWDQALKVIVGDSVKK